MTKQEKIEEYIRKTARKHGITCDEAKRLKLTQEYIKYIEEECRENELRAEIHNDCGC